MNRLASALTPLLCLIAVACGGTAANPPAAASTAPSIAITTQGSLNLGNAVDRPTPIAFTVANFTLKAPGMCAGAANCGHVHVLIDGAACNADASPYNVAAVASPALALVGKCSTAVGAHTVSMELHDDAHAAIKDAAGAAVSASQSLTFQENATAPSVKLTDPAYGATITLDAAKHYPVKFTVKNFTIAAPSACTGTNCGHVHLLIDGTACSSGGAYNAFGPTTGADAATVVADFSKCPTAVGAHTIQLQLHNDDHSAVKDEYGSVVSTDADVTAL